MARYSSATWKGPVPNQTPGGMAKILGVVLHIMEGSLDGSDNWFHNPQAQASSHFGTGKDGRVYQWVDTADKAWAQAAGNPNYISIENEGHAGDSLTDAQLSAVAGIVAWASKTHGVPLTIVDDPGGSGLGWHGMGGGAWGGHVSCPGDPIKAQRELIIAKAGGTTITTPTVPSKPKTPSTPGGVKAMFDPAIGPIVAAAKWPDAPGGMLLLAPNGAVYALFGAPYFGGANEQSYFAGRTAAKFAVDANGVAVKNEKGGYTIVATSGETYNYSPPSP